MAIQIDRAKLEQAIKQFDGKVQNFNQLCHQACEAYNGMKVPVAIKPHIVKLRIDEWGLAIQSKPGKRGRPPLSEEEKARRAEARANGEPIVTRKRREAVEPAPVAAPEPKPEPKPRLILPPLPEPAKQETPLEAAERILASPRAARLFKCHKLFPQCKWPHVDWDYVEKELKRREEQVAA